MERLEKVYTVKLSEIPKVTADIEAFCEKNGVGADACFAFTLALDELFTNIVSYGFPVDSEEKVQMELSLEKGAMKVVLKDSSPEFDPFTDAPDPELKGGLEERNVGGLGIFFVKKSMDEVKYARKNGVNEVTLLKKLKGAVDA